MLHSIASIIHTVANMRSNLNILVRIWTQGDIIILCMGTTCMHTDILVHALHVLEYRVDRYRWENDSQPLLYVQGVSSIPNIVQVELT